jgi:hypothetical protein
MPAIKALSRTANQFEKQTCWMADVRAYRTVVHAVAMLSDEREGVEQLAA